MKLTHPEKASLSRAFYCSCLLILMAYCPVRLLDAAHRDTPPIGTEYVLSHGGIERKFYVHLPSGFGRDRKWPVVVAFHGGGGDPLSIAKQTSLNRKADLEGFIAVYPEGTGPLLFGRRIGTFNAGKCCGYAEKNRVDDVGFVVRILDRLKAQFPIDENRIYAMGHSNGALMSYRLACELPDKIAAIAANAGHDGQKSCRPLRAVPILHFHGTTDPSVPYTGGKCGGRTPGDAGWKCSSVPDYLETWALRNGCRETARVTYQRGKAVCRTYAPCENSAEVTLCMVEGSGHTWPGGSYAVDRPAWERRVGAINHDISATDFLWEFFKRHPRTITTQ